MSLKINNDGNRLTRAELDEYTQNSGITALQADIIRLRYFEPHTPTVTHICEILNISPRKYNYELNKALRQIRKYEMTKDLY